MHARTLCVCQAVDISHFTGNSTPPTSSSRIAGFNANSTVRVLRFMSQETCSYVISDEIHGWSHNMKEVFARVSV